MLWTVFEHTCTTLLLLQLEKNPSYQQNALCEPTKMASPEPESATTRTDTDGESKVWAIANLMMGPT